MNPAPTLTLIELREGQKFALKGTRKRKIKAKDVCVRTSSFQYPAVFIITGELLNNAYSACLVVPVEATIDLIQP